MPFFTLILPCYKVAAYVERCVRSILEQDFKDYEMILVDDGSPDETTAICDRLAAEHPCIRVIHKENGGLSSARNTGMAAASGRYIWFIDSDDWIEPGALQLLHEACADGQPEIVKFSHYRVTDKAVHVEHGVPAGWYEGRERCDLLRQTALRDAGTYSLSACFHVYRQDFLISSSVHFVSERTVGSEDYLFNLQLLLRAEHIRVLTEPLYSYEMRQGSLTQTYKSDLAMRYVALRHQLREDARSMSAEQYLPLIDRFFLWHLIAGTCFSQEYRTITPAHTLQAARRNVRALLRLEQVQMAVRKADAAGLKWQKRVQLLAMRLRAEPLFCYLYAGKRSAR